MDRNLRIRRATIGDAPAIVPLLEQLGYPSSLSEVRERLEVILERTDYATWVAQHGERVVGLAGARLGYAYEVSGIYGQLIALVVEKAYRGRGIGAALVREAEEWVKQRGGRTMALNSGTHRAEAHKFYERLGYVATGLRFVKKLQSGEDSM